MTNRNPNKVSRRFWATPSTVSIPKSDINSIASSFAVSVNSLPEDYQSEDFHAITARHIKRLGGNGDMALELIGDWVESPYESVLRWAVTVSIGRDLEDEIAKVQYRSDEAFEAHIKAEFKSRIPANIITQYGNMTEDQIEYHLKSAGQARRAEVGKYISSLMAMKEKRFKHVMSHKKMDKSAKIASTKECQKTLAAIVTLTQAMTRHEETPLMRGLHGYQAKRLLERAKEAKSVPIAFDHATSFTSEPLIANEFALWTHASKNEPQDGAIITVHVPRSSMVASDIVFHSLKGEYETVVATHGSLMISSKDISVV